MMVLGTFSIFTTSKAIIMGLVLILYAGWIYILLTNTGELTWSLSKFLGDVTNAIGRVPPFNKLGFPILAMRFYKFVFQDNVVPQGFIFCYFWNFGQIGLMGWSVPVIYYTGSYLLEIALIIIIFAVQILLLIMGFIKDFYDVADMLNKILKKMFLMIGEEGKQYLDMYNIKRLL